MRKLYVIVTLFGLILVNCGDLCSEATWQRSCESIHCNEPDDIAKYDDGYTKFYECTWYCAHYNDAERYVSVSFISSAGDPCWRLDNIYTTSCIGNCYE